MSGSSYWNVPNKITAARLVLSVVVFALIPLGQFFMAFVIFILAASTDWVDGWYARKYNLVTKLGRILDPFCDKVLICGAYILIAEAMVGFPWYAKIAGWMAVIVVGRELLVTVIRSLIEGSGGDFSAKMAGKLKMWFQCIAVGSCLLALAKAESLSAPELPVWLWTVMIGSTWLAVASTIQSGIEYVQAASKLLGDVAKPD